MLPAFKKTREINFVEILQGIRPQVSYVSEFDMVLFLAKKILSSCWGNSNYLIE